MLYILFYLAFCLYVGYVLRTRLSVLLLVISFVAWALIKYSGIDLSFMQTVVVLVISYFCQWLVLLHCLPKRVRYS